MIDIGDWKRLDGRRRAGCAATCAGAEREEGPAATTAKRTLRRSG
jgi:hypothetical protein